MSVDLQPTLRGTLLTLRPLHESDWNALFAVASDPLLWEQHPASNRYHEDVFRTFFSEAVNTGSALVAIDATDGRVIGSSRYHGHDPVAREIEIGWSFVARSHWGGRYNREMKQLMLAHAFTFVDRVVFCIGERNTRSRVAAGRIGAVLLESHAAAGPETVVYGLSRGQST